MFGVSKRSSAAHGSQLDLTPAWVSEGLGEHVIALAWAPRGRTLAAAAVGGPILLIDGGDGRTLHRLPGHGFGTASLAWSPDGTLLASGGQDGVARLWDAAAGEPRGELAAGSAWVERVAWTPTGAPLLATAAGKRLRLWDAAGQLVREYPSHASTIADIQWKPLARELASASYGRLAIWSPDRDEPRRVFEWKGSMLAAAWSPSGRYLATGNQDSTVHFWILKTGQDLQMWGYATKVRELAWDRTGQYLATGGGPEACVWDCGGKGPAGTRPRQLGLTGGAVAALAFHPGWEPLLAVGFSDGAVGLWTLGRKAARVGMFRVESGITQTAWSPDGKLLAVANETGGVAAFTDPAWSR